MGLEFGVTQSLPWEWSNNQKSWGGEKKGVVGKKNVQQLQTEHLCLSCSFSLTLNKLRQQRALEERLNQKRAQQMSKLQTQQQTEVVVSN